jgi:hypothetical protein
MLQIHGQCYHVSECICSVQRVLQSDFRKDTILGQVNYNSGEMDRTGLKILENNKNIQSIVSVKARVYLKEIS